MLIGILSDTHNQLERTLSAVELLTKHGVQALFHCGDFTGPQIVRACASLPLYFTFGNNDDDSIPELRHAATELKATCVEWGGVVELGGKRIGLIHGHMTSDRRRVLSMNPDYLLFGHSHIAGDSMESNVRRINPGALHRAKQFTVALLDLESDTLQYLTLK